MNFMQRRKRSESDSRWEYPLSLVDVIPILFTIFSVYMVIGCIWTGQASFLEGRNPIILVLLLLILISLIGGLEGLQIAVATLERRSLDELQDKYSRAHRLHKEFKMKDPVVMDFFSGRQLLIVVLVFMAARLTSFPDVQTWPFTETAFPGWMTPWFQEIFLKLGLLGAFVTYWFGNLAPQIIATFYPVRFLDRVPGMGTLFYLCMFIDKIHLPSPSKIVAFFATRHWEYEKIPISAEEEYRRSMEFGHGFAASELSYLWEFYLDQVKIVYQLALVVGGESIHEVYDNTLGISTDFTIRSLNYQGKIERSDGTERELLTNDISYYTQKIDQDRNYFYFKISDPEGKFSKEDLITLNVEVTLEADATELKSDLVKLNHPTKRVSFRLNFSKAYNIDPPIVYSYDPPYGFARDMPSMHEELETNSSEGEWYETEYEEEYPQQRRIYKITWNARCP